MFEHLVETIQALQTRIHQHGAHIGRYEKRTRVALIDPMLCALGWDVAKPEVVEVETKTTDGWADYALLDGNRRPLVFVEAKKLEEREPPIAQVVGYATQENTRGANVRYCLCTNGDYWQLLDIRSQTPVVFFTHISLDNPAKIALGLVGLWRPSLSDGLFSPALGPLPQEPNPNQSAQASETLSRHSVEQATGWTSLDTEFPCKGQPPPSRMRLPDGTETQIAHWRYVLIETARWLSSAGVLTVERWREPFGKKLLFSRSGTKSRNGGDLRDPRPINKEGDLYVETGLNTPEMLRYTKLLMERCGHPPSKVSVRLATEPQ